MITRLQEADNASDQEIHQGLEKIRFQNRI